jgi:ABC-type dipeptide/oligopeptide/nickel transport system permease subunit
MSKDKKMMSDNSETVNGTINEAPPRVKGIRRFARVFFARGVVMFGLVVITALVLTAIFAPFIAPYDPYKQNLDNILSKPNSKHLVGVVAIFIAAAIGMLLGLTAGYLGGITNTVIMRLIDAIMTFPMILLALTIAAILGVGLKNIILALGVSLVPPYARLMCGQALSVKQNDYVMAGRAMGAGNLRIMLRHVAPNCFPPLIVLMTMMMGSAILAEAGLSFLGIGISPPGAAWGAMVSEGYRYLLTTPVLSFAPGLAIMLVVFAFNMVGDGLRDALDPRLRGTI